MRALVLTAVLLGSSSLYPAFAQEEGKSQSPNQAHTVPVQPERTPQQSEQSRERAICVLMVFNQQDTHGLTLRRDMRNSRHVCRIRFFTSWENQRELRPLITAGAFGGN